MDQTIYQNYLTILKKELVPALGCTEPIAVAFCAAKANEVLNEKPKKMEVWCSGNIIKNVKGVTVPNSNGMKGIDVAAILGMIGGDPSKGLEVLTTINNEHIEETKKLLKTDFCSCHLIEGSENLHIITKLYSENHFVSVEIKDKHTNIIKIIKDDEIIFEKDYKEEQEDDDIVSTLNVKDIIDFANEVNLDDVKDILDKQITMNENISNEGLKNPYGANVGKTILEMYGEDNIIARAKAKAAAGSDARMSGCSLPVVINSGSGNQGMTVSLPVIEYARYLNSSKDKLYRALVLSNLIALHQKRFIGRLSAYCGAVSAACASGAAITYLHDGTIDEISKTITNTIANVGGIVCDGAKPSCAAKIASSLDAAITAHYMAMKDRVFLSGDGLVKDNVEKTIQSVGRMGRVGMHPTDIEILNIMVEK